MPQNETVIVNFQTTRQVHDRLVAVARTQERSVSAEIRLAVRAWLQGQSPPQASGRQQESAA